MYRHILISTDGSEVAQKGVDHGIELAKAIGARTTIIAVTQVVMPYLPAGPEMAAFPFQEFADIEREAAEKALAKVAEQARSMGVQGDTVCVEHAPPAEAIVEAAKSRSCDLITMSSHGRRGVRRLILGSVTSEVLVLSPVPVLVVR